MRTPTVLLLSIGTLWAAGAAATPLPDVVTSYALSGAGCDTGALSLTLGQAATQPPGCALSASFLAAGSPDPAVSFSLNGDASGQAVQASLSMTYYFRIVSAVDALVPVSLDGAFFLFGGTPGLTGSSRVNVSDGFSVFGANSLDGPPSGSFHMTDSFMTNVGYQIFLEADGSYRGVNAISAMLDPTLSIDPAWLSAHPDAILELSAGLGNTSPVPEPPTWLLGAIGGLALLPAIRRQRRREGSARLEAWRPR